MYILLGPCDTSHDGTTEFFLERYIGYSLALALEEEKAYC